MEETPVALLEEELGKQKEKRAIEKRKRRNETERSESPRLPSIVAEEAKEDERMAYDSNVTDHEVLQPSPPAPGFIAVTGRHITNPPPEIANDSWNDDASALDHVTLPPFYATVENKLGTFNATIIDEAAEQKTQRRRRMITVLISCGVVTLVAIVAVTVVLNINKPVDNPVPKTFPPTAASIQPTSSPTVFNLNVFLVQNSFDNGVALSNDLFPKKLAMVWLENIQAASELQSCCSRTICYDSTPWQP